MKILEPLVKRYSSHQLSLHYYLIARIEREAAHDYKGVVEICQDAIQLFKSRPAAPKTVVASFCHALSISSTMLGKFDEAEIAIQYAESLLEEGTFNWYKNREYHLVLKFYQKDYPGAYAIFKKAVHHSKHETLPGNEKESWKIYEGFIYLFMQAGKIIPEKKPLLKPEKFLNEVPEYSKDKRGMNIPVLVIHVLFLLHLQRHEEAYDRMLALEKYAGRHLKSGDDTFRSWCFIQALLQIPKAEYQQKESEEKAAEYLKQMSTVPAMLIDQPHEVEAIPYEHLWDMAMEALERGGAISDMRFRILEEA